jgi:hypothetical protein
MEFKDRIQTKKGELGERIVKDILQKKGYVVYTPSSLKEDKAHIFDFLVMKKIENKKEIFVVEVKSKARLNKWPATGIDIRHFNEYLFIHQKNNLDFFLFFVDEHPNEQRIYGQRLSTLIAKKVVEGIEYPNTNLCKGKILFPLSDMKQIYKLNLNEVEQLKSMSSRNHQYE